MQTFRGDRRKTNQHSPFPLIDSGGCLVASERRSGKDRRKNKRGEDVAGKILKILN